MMPKYYTITSDEAYEREDFLNRLVNNLEHGQALIQIRMKVLPHNEFMTICKMSVHLGEQYNADIILNADIETVKQLNARGVHLTSQALMQCNTRPLSKDKLVSAACHSMEELLHAEKIGADFVTLSPVLVTTTHPGSEPLGWENFTNMVKQVTLPVYALGGLTEEDLTIALNNGAQGIAAIRSLWYKRY